MKEKELNFNIDKNTKIYGVLNLPDSDSDSVIIMVHGLTGHMNEHQFFNAAKFFNQKGFTVYRFNLYDWRKKSRKFREFTLEQAGKDLDFVVNKLKNKGFNKIGVIGHSYGGPTILVSNIKNYDVMAFWDPSFKS